MMSVLKAVLCSLAFSAGMSMQAQSTEAVKLVRLNVVVTDSHGQPVTDLSADDFRVTDEGKTERLVSFHNSAKNAVPAGAEERSNRPSPVPQTTAILFDFLNLNRTDRLDASHRIGQALKGLESGENVYFYLLAPDGKIDPIHEMHPGKAGDKSWTQEIEALLAKALKAENKAKPAGMVDEEVVKKTYVALETMGNQLAAFPGRRDIVWVTAAVPNVSNPKTTCSGDWIDCSLYVPHLAVILAADGATVNPFCYSLVGPSVNHDMEDIAGLTGGRAYFNEDMRAVVKQMADGASGTYTIAYDPSRESWDSKFHKVKVTTERKGVKVQWRQRYYSVPETLPAQDRERNALVIAFQSLSDISDIGLRALVAPAAAANMVHVEMRVDASDLMLHENGAQFDDQLVLLYSARSAAGPQGEPSFSTFDLHMTREQRDAAMKDGVAIARDYPVDSATQKVRLMVLDRATNAVGSLTIPVGAAH